MCAQQTPQGKDPQLWELARRRASFRTHFIIYLVMVVFFWAVWYLSGPGERGSRYPWPVWPMLGWGIGVLFHYLGAYVKTGAGATEREYEKLIRNQEQ